jgi:hypothetical protein
MKSLSLNVEGIGLTLTRSVEALDVGYTSKLATVLSAESPGTSPTSWTLDEE